MIKKSANIRILNFVLFASIFFMPASSFGQAALPKLKLPVFRETVRDVEVIELPPEKKHRVGAFFSSRTFYDSWENDLTAPCKTSTTSSNFECSLLGASERDNTEKGQQLTELIQVTAYYDDIQLSVSTSYVDSSYDKDIDETVIGFSGGPFTVRRNTENEGTKTIKTYTDTQLSLAYKRDQVTGGNWGYEVAAVFNLPTGKDKLTQRELKALPSDDVVETTSVGKGFDWGPEGKIFFNKADSRWFLGGSYTRAGKYDPTATETITGVVSGDNDSIDAGNKATFSIGSESTGIGPKRWKMQYEYGISDIGGTDATSHTGFASWAHDDKWIVGFTVALTYSSIKQDSIKSTNLQRQPEYRDGFFGFLKAELGYRFVEDWAVKLFTDLQSAADSDPQDPTYFISKDKVAGGISSSYRLGKTATLEGYYKLFNVTADVPYTRGEGGLDRGGKDTVEFDGWQAFVGINFAFSTGI